MNGLTALLCTYYILGALDEALTVSDTRPNNTYVVIFMVIAFTA